MYYFCLAKEVLMFASEKVKPGYTGCTNQPDQQESGKRCCRSGGRIIKGLLFDGGFFSYACRSRKRGMFLFGWIIYWYAICLIF